MAVSAQEQAAAIKKQRSINDAWNLFSVISSIIGMTIAVDVGVDAQIAKINQSFGLDIPSPTNHGLVAQVSSPQAVTGFEAAALAGGIMGAFCSSSALHDYLIADKKEHLKAVVNFVQYTGSVLLAGASIAMLVGAASFVLVKIMPFVVMALVAVNVLYNLGLMFANLYRAWKASDSDRKAHLKAALNNLVSLVLNTLVILSVVLFLGPLFAALKAAVAGNTAPLAAVFSNPLQILLASTFVATGIAAITKTLAGAKQEIKQAFVDPIQAYKDLYRSLGEVSAAVAKSFSENKFKGAAHAVLAVVTEIVRVVVKALMLLVPLLAHGVKKGVSAMTCGLFGNSAAKGSVSAPVSALAPASASAN